MNIMGSLKKRRIIYVVNVDWFFISHRMPLAQNALDLGWDVFLISKNTGRFDELKKSGISCIDIDFERSGKNPLKELHNIKSLRKIYKNIQPDIIHHVTLKPAIYGTIAANQVLKNVRIINAVSGLGYTFTAGRTSISKIILINLMRYAFKNKRSNFIFQNPDDKLLYDKLNFLSQDNSRIIKGSGVDEKVFLEKKYTSTSGLLTVVLLARMLKDKGVIEFIKAANILRSKYSDKIKFVLVGGIDTDNPSHISLTELNSYIDQTYITWLGHQTNVIEIYNSSDIVCLPSYREGLPKSLVEAMAVGCPIITTDAIGCKECVEHGFNGFIVPTGDASKLAESIEVLINNDNLRIEMGHNSRMKMIKEMSLSTVINKTFNFYEN